MASASIDTCQLCANSFNYDFYRSVSLPCGHDFCLPYLVRLKASGKHKCPTCRSSWAGFEVAALPGMDALAGALHVDLEDEDSSKEKGSDGNCNNHSMPYDFWVSTKKEFYCKGCAAKNPPVKLELIQNAIPQIKEAFAAELPNAKEEVKSYLLSLDEMHAEFVRHRNSVVQFIKSVQTLIDNINENIYQISDFRSKMLDTAANLKKLEHKVDSIKSIVDFPVAVECKSTLEKAAVRFSPPTPDHSKTLLFNIACSYAEEAETANLPIKASFVNAIVMGSPLPKTLKSFLLRI